jgi:hypothetical protein
MSICALVLTLAVVLALTAGAAQGAGEVIDLSERGPQVGETISDFNLADQYGET